MNVLNNIPYIEKIKKSMNSTVVFSLSRSNRLKCRILKDNLKNKLKAKSTHAK